MAVVQYTFTQTIERTTQITTLVARFSGRHGGTKFARLGARDFEVVRQEWEKMKLPVMRFTSLYSLLRITLDNELKKKNVSVMNMLLVYLFDSMKLEKEHQIGSSFKIMLHYDILQNRLKCYTEWWFK